MKTKIASKYRHIVTLGELLLIEHAFYITFHNLSKSLSAILVSIPTLLLLIKIVYGKTFGWKPENRNYHLLHSEWIHSTAAWKSFKISSINSSGKFVIIPSDCVDFMRNKWRWSGLLRMDTLGANSSSMRCLGHSGFRSFRRDAELGTVINMQQHKVR